MEGKNISTVVFEGMRDIHDFPIPGIVFKDISPLLANPESMRLVTQAFADQLKGIEYDKLVALESRGFIFGAPLSQLTNKGLVLIRKKGKLPGKVEQVAYGLEYGKDVIEIQSDALKPGERVVIVDDILATGGTVKAASELIEKVGGKVAAAVFLYEVGGLGGAEKLAQYKLINLHQL